MEFQGVPEIVEGVSRLAQGVSGSTKRFQGRFKGIPGGFREYYEVSWGVQWGFRVVRQLTGIRGVSGSFCKYQGGDLWGDPSDFKRIIGECFKGIPCSFRIYGKHGSILSGTRL